MGISGRGAGFFVSLNLISIFPLFVCARLYLAGVWVVSAVVPNLGSGNLNGWVEVWWDCIAGW